MTPTPPNESRETRPDPLHVKLCGVTGLANVNRLVDELADSGVPVSTDLPYELLVLDVAVTITIAVVLVRRRRRQNES